MSIEFNVPPVNRIDLILRTTSPWHVAYPDNGEKEKSEEGGQKLVSRTLKKRLGNSRIPYFAANGIRGALRRHARDLLLPYLTETRGPISTDFYNGLSCGAASGKPDNSPNSIEELVRSSEHIYMGLFGGGARLLSSKLQASDINIICQDTLQKHIVNLSEAQKMSVEAAFPDVFGENPCRPQHFVDIRHITRVDDIIRGLKKSEVEAIEGGAEAIAAHYNAGAENKKARAEGAKKKTVANLLNLEVIPENTPLHFSLSFSPDVTEAQIGMLVMCLQSLLRRNYFGGYGRTGFGKARVEAITLVSESYDMEIRKGGDDIYDEKGLFKLPSEFTPLQKVALSEMEILDVEEFESFFKDISELKKKAS